MLNEFIEGVGNCETLIIVVRDSDFKCDEEKTCEAMKIFMGPNKYIYRISGKYYKGGPLVCTKYDPFTDKNVVVSTIEPPKFVTSSETFIHHLYLDISSDTCIHYLHLDISSMTYENIYTYFGFESNTVFHREYKILYSTIPSIPTNI